MARYAIIAGRKREQTQTCVYDPNRDYAPLAHIDHASASPQQHRIYYFQTDPTGTSREVTDEAGTLLWEGQHKAWGKFRANTASPSGFA